MEGRRIPGVERAHGSLRGARALAVVVAVVLTVAAALAFFEFSQEGRALADDTGAPTAESTLSAAENPSDGSDSAEPTLPPEEPAPAVADKPEGTAEAEDGSQETTPEGTPTVDPAEEGSEPSGVEGEGAPDQPGDEPDTSGPASGSDPASAVDPEPDSAADDPADDPTADPEVPAEDPATPATDQPATAGPDEPVDPKADPAATDPKADPSAPAETPADDPYAPYAPEDLLFSEAVQTDSPDLDGASVAIVNRMTGLSLTASPASVNGVDALAGRAASVTEVDGLPRVVNDDAVFWTFSRAAEGGNSYYLSTEVDGTTYYLRLGAQPYNSSNDGRGSLTLSADPQAITVTAYDDGTVALGAPVGNGTGYINADAWGQAFWAYNSPEPQNSHQTLCYAMPQDVSYIHYDLNLPSLENRGTYWSPAPTLVQASQPVSEETASLAPQPDGYAAEAGPAGIPNLYRFSILPTSGLPDGSGLPEPMRSSWYGEEAFVGWDYTDAEGATHRFAPDAPARYEGGLLYATDAAGAEVALPADATLVGAWEAVSNVITFFVNYTGTILDVEGDVADRNSGDFTGAVAVGHIFYGEGRVGQDGIFGADANQQISALFVPSFDAARHEPQIVVSFLKRYDGATGTQLMDVAAPGANPRMLEDATLALIRQAGLVIKVSSGEGTKPTLDPALADSDHYQIRWYVLKEQDDTWHVDGVLVAKTQEVEVTKAIYGLTDEQVDALMAPGGFAVDALLGTDRQPYLTMTCDDAATGDYHQYVYNGMRNGVAHWTMNAIEGEHYTLAEQAYQLPGYDVSTLLVVYGRDGSSLSASGSTTEVLPDGAWVVGGQTQLVSFTNLYTPQATGALAVVKRAGSAQKPGALLPGAVFSLYALDENGTPSAEPAVSAVTDSLGAAYLDGLAPGRYLLRETTAPEGFDAPQATWTVDVVRDDANVVTVTVMANDADGSPLEDTAQVCYVTGQPAVAWQVFDEPHRTTLTFTKTFSGLSDAALARIVAGSTAENVDAGGYAIELVGTDASGAVGAHAVVSLAEASRGPDGITFTWTLPGIAVEAADGSPLSFTIVERGYAAEGYAEALVSLRVNGEPTAISVSHETGTPVATAEGLTLPDASTLGLVNTYSNRYDLHITKVDANGGAPLAGVTFTVYGSYAESVDTDEWVDYRDPETGEQARAYYLGSCVTDDAGVAVWPGLLLSTEAAPRRYVVYETVPAAGYQADRGPWVVSVRSGPAGIDVLGPGFYDSGVYSMTVLNEAGRLMPATGGVDRNLLAFGGVVLAAFGAAGLWAVTGRARPSLAAQPKKEDKR